MVVIVTDAKLMRLLEVMIEECDDDDDDDGEGNRNQGNEIVDSPPPHLDASYTGDRQYHVNILPSIFQLPYIHCCCYKLEYTLSYTKMDDPWADTPSSATVVIPPRPPKADRRSIPQPQLQPKAVESEPEPQQQEEEEEEEEEVKADETPVLSEEETISPGLVESSVTSNANGHEHEHEHEGGFGTEDEDGGDGFDDFDDFDAPAGGPSTFAAQEEGDGFGDFGDFEEGDFDEPLQVNGGSAEGVNEVQVEEVPIKKWVSSLNHLD